MEASLRRDLISLTPDATEWVRQQRLKYTSGGMFGKVERAVLWTHNAGSDEKPIVPVDASSLASEINTIGLTLLDGHDPGRPVGKAVAAAVFITPEGTEFVAALLGFYHGGNQLSFADLGLKVNPDIKLPDRLSPLSTTSWLGLHIDPREVPSGWAEDLLRTSPIRIESAPQSHNADSVVNELITVVLPYAAAVWNPFVKAIGTKAGEDIYAAINWWLRKLVDKLSELNDPIVPVTSNRGDCHVSFILRGNNRKQNHAALDALPGAATKADALIKNVSLLGYKPIRIVYEFDKTDNSWYPSFVELDDGRLITNGLQLVAAEGLPAELSLGLRLDPPVDSSQDS